jgi:hypothetical protein
LNCLEESTSTILEGAKEMEAIRMQQTIEKKGELILHNLPVEKGQQVEVLILLFPTKASKRPRLTARQLRQSTLIGLWKEREDIVDSASYARKLREQAQRRPQIGGITDDHSG